MPPNSDAYVGLRSSTTRLPRAVGEHKRIFLQLDCNPGCAKLSHPFRKGQSRNRWRLAEVRFFASCNYPKSWLPHLAPMSGGQRRVPPTNIQRNIVCERGRVSQRRLMETISPNTKRTALRSRLLVGTLEATCFRFQQLQ